MKYPLSTSIKDKVNTLSRGNSTLIHALLNKDLENKKYILSIQK